MILLQAARAAKLPKIVQKSRCPDASGLCVNVPYGARTTAASEARAYAIASIASTEVQWFAIGRWFN